MCYLRNVGDGTRPKNIVVNARAVLKKHPDDEAAKFFASVGDTKLKNTERDFLRRCRRAFGVDLEPWFVEVPIVSKTSTSDISMFEMAALAPHEVFAALHRAGRQFAVAMLGPSGTCSASSYWCEFGRSMNDHVLSSPDMASTVPLWVHSDGGEVFNTTEFSIFSWSSALVQDINPFDYKNLICLMPEEWKVKRETDAAIIEFISWSLRVLEAGVFPSTDHRGRPLTGHRQLMAGQPIAGGWRASLVGTLGDLKEKTKIHRLKRNYACNFFCDKCLCCRHMECGNGYDFRASAMWRMMPVSHELYLRTTPVGDRSPWCNHPSWSIYRHRDDMLHGWWLGFVKDVSGQLLFDLAGGDGADLDVSLKSLWLEMKAWLKDRGVTCNVKCFKKSTLVDKAHDFPSLKAEIKASQSKLIFLRVARKAIDVSHEGEESGYNHLRATTCWNLLQVVRIFDDHEGPFLPEDAAKAAADHGELFLVTYQTLAASAIAFGRTAWRVRPKLHYAAHTFDEVRRTGENPRRQDLFDAEDFIGKVKRVASKCHGATASLRTVQRMIVFLCERWCSAQGPEPALIAPPAGLGARPSR